MVIKPYNIWMFNEFQQLFSKTAGEMNVSKNEIGNRVGELVYWNIDNKSPFLTAWDEGHMVGYILLKREDKGAKKSSAHVAQARISVQKEFQGKGIGTALFKAAISKAQEQGVIKRIEILNYEPSIDDRHWFEKLGFVNEGRLRNRICLDDKLVDAYLLALYL